MIGISQLSELQIGQEYILVNHEGGREKVTLLQIQFARAPSSEIEKDEREQIKEPNLCLLEAYLHFQTQNGKTVLNAAVVGLFPENRQTYVRLFKADDPILEMLPQKPTHYILFVLQHTRSSS